MDFGEGQKENKLRRNPNISRSNIYFLLVSMQHHGMNTMPLEVTTNVLLNNQLNPKLLNFQYIVRYCLHTPNWANVVT
jgi:hypothetical protein